MSTFPARYADGRAATTHEAMCEIGAEGVVVTIGANEVRWLYAEIRRADDGNGRIILRLKKGDRGERVSLEGKEVRDALKQAAPQLFRPTAQGVESRALVGGLTASAMSLAASFLIGVPMAAEPVARIMPPRYTDQIGDIAWSQVEALTVSCDDSDEAATVLNNLATRLMTDADIAVKDEVWVTIVGAGFPNAFALPDNSIVVTSDLIAMASHPDEVAGVLAHEIGHIEHRHVMTNIIRNIGAGVFFDIVFGGAGAGQAIAIASVNLASLRYNRADETEADESGLNYLDRAGIDPAALARFFDRMAEMEHEMGVDIPTLLSSHPASAERARVARQRGQAGRAPSLTDAEWRVVRSACGMDPDAPPPGEEEEAPAAQTPPDKPAAEPTAPADAAPTPDSEQ